MADDLFVGGNSEEEILRNYERVLQRLAYHQRKLICLRATTILEWHWS